MSCPHCQPQTPTSNDLRQRIEHIRRFRDWKKAIKDVLLANGVSEDQIAERIGTLEANDE